ncbi:pyridoxamine 5'-phosphate oxidase family protein [Streptomyces prunicolor]|uniref:pyridoxamine 5'-phosphate oxidase family protein n=1 Tax=Streptomyces prunicolor TaxID=67348 RepID=UPI0003799474|nr:pyridoxamine 5'-phosphate oxidase family protein [Streptomyces prunicolor]MCX5235790.1 pyridoxamine 5'-phosphate oxidase family protein [Streptomyces prunicolor]
MPLDAQPGDEQLAVDLLARTDHGRVATTLRALPFLAFASHIVQDGRLLLRMPRSHGYHHACVGSVVAYGADNLGSAGPGEGLWSVQVVGACESYDPTADQVERFGPAPGTVDDEPYEPVYLRIEPQLSTVHTTDGGLERHFGPTL